MINTGFRRCLAALLIWAVALTMMPFTIYGSEPDGSPAEEETDEALFCLSEDMQEGLLEEVTRDEMISENLLPDNEQEEISDVRSDGAVLVEKVTLTDEDMLPENNELLEGYLEEEIEKELGNEHINNDTTARGDVLSPFSKAVYDRLVPEIRKAANGQLATAAFAVSIDPEKYLTDGSGGYYSAAQLGISDINSLTYALKYVYCDKIGYDFSRIHQALLADMPYDLYWYDKTAGLTYSEGVSASYKVEDGVSKVKLRLNLTVSMNVAAAYSKTGIKKTNEINTKMTAKAANTVTNAMSVVNSNKQKSDYEKLKAYNDWICSNVDYNYQALSNGTPYGDPWQLIYVFDNDPSTKVVCEGYSKAFKLLFDLSSFSRPEMDCYITTGRMNNGNHMWNTVLMNDGKYYLADITNCDKGAIGYPYNLFLAGYNGVVGGVDSGFYVNCNGKKITYLYDENHIKQYSRAERSISGTKYDPKNAKPGSALTPTPTPTPKPVVTPAPVPMIPKKSLEDTGKEVSVECSSAALYSKAGAFPRVKVTYEGKILKEGFDYKLTYLNNKKIADENSSKPPKVKISGIGDFTGTITRTFTVNKADRSKIRLVATDKVYKNKPRNYKVIPKLTEAGKSLIKGKDVNKFTNKDFSYYYADTGIEIPEDESVPINTLIEVRLTAGIPESSPFEAGVETFIARYRLISSDVRLNKASVTVRSPGYVSYVSGEEIVIKPGDLMVSLGDRNLTADDYEISLVVINAKKTSARVTLKGRGDFGGSKTKTVKLKAVKE